MAAIGLKNALGRRVVITGIGCVTPLGCGVEKVWMRCLGGETGIRKLEEKNIVTGAGVSVSASVPRGKSIEEGQYDEEVIFGRLVGKELAEFSQYALYASDLALSHAGLIRGRNGSGAPLSDAKSWELELHVDSERAGVAIASGGIGSLLDIVDTAKNLEKSYKKVSPYFVPKVLTNMPGGQVSIRYGLKGPVTSVATACAAATHAIGDAYNFIRLGYADLMLAGGTEGSLNPLSIAGFARLRALSNNTDPTKASRPFDASRDGFVIAEGAAVLVLEELSVAQARGAPIIAEIVGYGLSGDGYHATHPPEDGSGAERSMKQALKDAQIDLEDVGYINAHATSTPIGDNVEVRAIEKVFSGRTQATTNVHTHDNCPLADIKNSTQNNIDAHTTAPTLPLFVSATKGSTGHLLGAAGAIETAFTALALRDQIIPPTLNLDKPDLEPQCFSHVPYKPIRFRNPQLTDEDFDREGKPYIVKRVEDQMNASLFPSGVPPASARASVGTSAAVGTSASVGTKPTYWTDEGFVSTVKHDESQKAAHAAQVAGVTGSVSFVKGGNDGGHVDGVLKYAMKNSFGFGGMNATLVLAKYVVGK